MREPAGATVLPIPPEAAPAGIASGAISEATSPATARSGTDRDGPRKPFVVGGLLLRLARQRSATAPVDQLVEVARGATMACAKRYAPEE